jgi:16S rRNA (guanine966-N2)-methyltransferase
MRVIGGKYKGRRFSGKIPSGVRPSTDAVRETIFNILANYIDFEGLEAADVCAGTGGLGIEAISRGAAHCDFIEKNYKVSKLINKACSHYGVDKGRYSVITKDAVKYLSSVPSIKPACRYDLIFTDPPYASKLVNPIIETIYRGKLISPKGILVAEHGAMEEAVIPENWELLRTRKFGSTIVSFILVDY